MPAVPSIIVKVARRSGNNTTIMADRDELIGFMIQGPRFTSPVPEQSLKIDLTVVAQPQHSIRPIFILPMPSGSHEVRD